MSGSVEVGGEFAKGLGGTSVLSGDQVTNARMPGTVATLNSLEGLNAVLCAATQGDELHVILLVAGQGAVQAAIVDKHAAHLQESLRAWEAEGVVRIEFSTEHAAKTVEVPLHIDGWAKLLLQRAASLAEAPSNARDFAKFVPILRRLSGLYQVSCEGMLKVL